MKNEMLCGVVGTVGGIVAAALGGWDASLKTLVVFMALDYFTGLVVAGVFKNSRKTENGALDSGTCFKGLCRKGMTLLYVLVAARLDLIIGTTYIRDAVCIAFMTNELISLVENAGLMGIPVPAVITRAVEVLKNRSEEGNDNGNKDTD